MADILLESEEEESDEKNLHMLESKILTESIFESESESESESEDSDKSGMFVHVKY